jgi:hypothetical protein
MGLVIWIAIFVKRILDLLGYMDDSFSFDVEGNVMCALSLLLSD